MGITKASLATDSWLSPPLPGDDEGPHRSGYRGQARPPGRLKENIIIGKLIPAVPARVLQPARTASGHADAELLPAWAQVSDDDLDLASLLGELGGADSTFSADLSAFQNIGTATYDESALPRTTWQPEDELGGRAI